MDNTALGTYEMLALEYYDSTRHPTCVSFRQASCFLLREWLQLLLSQSGWVCEVGPGKSLIAELLAQQGQTLDSLVLVDSSPSMLAYSNDWRHRGAKLVLGDAEALPLASDSIAVVVSFLGDPYNSPQFWRETSRILKQGGLALLTAPSYEWAVAYRGESKKVFTSAEFELADGRSVRVPSLIYPVDEQINLIKSSGLVVEEVTHVPISALDEGQLSPKLRVVQGSKSSVVSGYRARKSLLQNNK